MKSTREIVAENRLSHWAQVMQERNESGMSIKAYSESVGLSTNVYYYWQQKLSTVEMTAKQGEGEAMTISQPSRPNLNTPRGWAVCETGMPEQRTTINNELQIEIGRSRVRVSKDTDTELLARVCRLLASIC